MSTEEIRIYLKSKNNALDDETLNKFVCDKIVKHLPLYAIEYCILFDDVKMALLSLNDSELNVISSIIKYSEQSGQDWLPISVKFFHLLSNDRYASLIIDVKENGLDIDLIPSFLFLTNNGNNFFNVQTIDDVKNIEVLRQNKLNEFNQTKSPLHLLLNKYGISYDTAFEYYKRYGKDALKLPDSIEKTFLLDLKDILEGKGIEEKYCNDYEFLANIDSRLRNFYSRVYNDSIYRINDEDFQYNFNYNGKNIPVYECGVDFTMSIYSYGLASSLKTPANFKDDWLRPSVEVDYLCNSIITSASMLTIVKHCVFGFCNFAENDISLVAPNDLGSGKVYDKPNVTSHYYKDKLGADVEFRVPQELVNNTRLTNNEVFRKRRRIQNGELIKVMPDYVVYFKTNENHDNDPIWLESLQAANDFGIPIVIVDCKKCLEYNVSKVEELMQRFESKYDNIRLLRNVFDLVYSLRSGYRNKPELLELYLNKQMVNDIVLRIYNHLEETAKVAPYVAVLGIDLFLKLIDEEFEKMMKAREWVGEIQKNGQTLQKPEGVIDAFKLLKERVSVYIENDLDNNLSFNI